jgi:hypothetical protein
MTYGVKIRKVVNRKLSDTPGVEGAVNAVVAANIGEPGQRTSVSSRQRVVQRNGHTVVDESEVRTDEGDNP